MAEFTIVRKEFADGPFYSFLADGVPSLKWFRECAVEGLPKDYYAQRCITRLKAGRSREAFGDAPAVIVDGQEMASRGVGDHDSIASALRSAGHDEGKVKQVLRALASPNKGRGAVVSETAATTAAATTRSGKPAPSRPVWRYVLDGQKSEQSYPTEAAAREACAVAAFMTRGKLGRVAEVQAALEDVNPGKTCRAWACPEEHGIRASVDGVEHLIGWEADGSFRFKLKPTEAE